MQSWTTTNQLLGKKYMKICSNLKLFVAKGLLISLALKNQATYNALTNKIEIMLYLIKYFQVGFAL